MYNTKGIIFTYLCKRSNTMDFAALVVNWYSPRLNTVYNRAQRHLISKAFGQSEILLLVLVLNNSTQILLSRKFSKILSKVWQTTKIEFKHNFFRFK